MRRRYELTTLGYGLTSKEVSILKEYFQDNYNFIDEGGYYDIQDTLLDSTIFMFDAKLPFIRLEGTKNSCSDFLKELKKALK